MEGAAARALALPVHNQASQIDANTNGNGPRWPDLNWSHWNMSLADHYEGIVYQQNTMSELLRKILS